MPVEVYRRPLRQALSTLFFGVAGLLCASAAVEATAPAAVVWTALCAGLLWIAVRAPFVRIEADAQRICFHNWFANVVVPWTQVAEFERPEDGGSFWRPGLRLRQADGRYQYATAFMAAPFDDPGFADAVVADLERLRQQHGPGERAAGG